MSTVCSFKHSQICEFTNEYTSIHLYQGKKIEIFPFVKWHWLELNVHNEITMIKKNSKSVSQRTNWNQFPFFSSSHLISIFTVVYVLRALFFAMINKTLHEVEHISASSCCHSLFFCWHVPSEACVCMSLLCLYGKSKHLYRWVAAILENEWVSSWIGNNEKRKMNFLIYHGS